MKRVILSAIMALTFLGANAQVWMGGSMEFNSTKYENVDKAGLTFGIRPEFGYTLTDKWDVAIGLGVTTKSDYPDVSDYTEFSLAPYARFTFAQMGKVGFFVDGGVDFGIEKKKHSDDESTFWIGLRPGVKYAASDKITFVAHLGSFGYKTIADREDWFGFNIDNSALTFGMYWNF